MIKLLRVDDRLIHGQVAMVWTSYLQVDTIVVANDKSAGDPFATMALNLAKPPSAELHILTLGAAIDYLIDTAHDRDKIFVVVNSTEDALKLSEKVDGIHEIILGGIRKSGDKVIIERQVFLDELDIINCKKMLELGRKVQIQVIPSEKVVSMTEAEKIWTKNKK